MARRHTHSTLPIPEDMRDLFDFREPDGYPRETQRPPYEYEDEETYEERPREAEPTMLGRGVEIVKALDRGFSSIGKSALKNKNLRRKRW